MNTPNNRWPRVVGFDVPKLAEAVDHHTNEAVTALLDVEPSNAWINEFRRQVSELGGVLGASDVVVDGGKIRFFGSISDSKALAAQVRVLVDAVSAKLRESWPQPGN